MKTQKHKKTYKGAISMIIVAAVIIVATGYLFGQKIQEYMSVEDSVQVDVSGMGKMMMNGQKEMRMNEKGQMYQNYFAGDHKLTPQERQEIIDREPMPIIGATYGSCYDSDADALESKYYPGTTEFQNEDGSVTVRKDSCTDDKTLTEFYCTRTLDSGDEYLLREWTYTCDKGCNQGACVF